MRFDREQILMLWLRKLRVADAPANSTTESVPALLTNIFAAAPRCRAWSGWRRAVPPPDRRQANIAPRRSEEYPSH